MLIQKEIGILRGMQLVKGENGEYTWLFLPWDSVCKVFSPAGSRHDPSDAGPAGVVAGCIWTVSQQVKG